MHVAYARTDGRTYGDVLTLRENSYVGKRAQGGHTKMLPDWTGTRAREDALRVPCRYCGAKTGELCVTKDDRHATLEAFPAHTMRTNDARKNNP